MFARARARRRARCLWGVLVCAAAIWSAPAGAYVRSRNVKTNSPLYWSDPRLALEVARPPSETGISTDDLVGASRAAIATWSYPQISCTGLSLRLTQDSTDSQVAGRDGTNRIIMRVGNWCRDPIALKHCHDDAAVALTTVFSRYKPGFPDDGEILEADIEVNAVGSYLWAVIPDGPISGRDFANRFDLRSVLTHETGHFIGLDHNCMLPGAPLLVDDKGIAFADCFALPSEIQMSIEDATMYPFMTTADVKLRTLTADDTRAACEIYPTLSVPFDEWTGGGGCAISPPRLSGSWGRLVVTTLITLATMVISTSRRGRRRRTPGK